MEHVSYLANVEPAQNIVRSVTPNAPSSLLGDARRHGELSR